MTACPCCGQQTKAAKVETLVAVVSPVFAEMVTLLATKPGEFFDTDQVARHIWRNYSDGGPLNAGTSITNLVAYNKRRLKALGYDVQGRLGRYGGYRLVITEDAR